VTRTLRNEENNEKEAYSNTHKTSTVATQKQNTLRPSNTQGEISMPVKG